ncbi:MAG: cysteine desulfurase NifS [Candidatus Omnitrophica bacterium CG08_land_8_20_14_0_20_41_16]|uniref:Cysteine desulfurase IscS n=1 Tax=Candidatus Sherwoodlollariibacterium unditelluris TaxID=1974757 RepID=A0A2G9YJU8_9BACT|nr:MAG: cysteine desulfurase NifS [Candidatus Omnitrophica bacterium CG23_combo_of_CG06-09_8_20_14_all_41_10]PIS33710.1 MAG: cysteine desulfurase NifS [Candidatus Omnitrophica bacterium CG08_land_8_20_14_0_20_41_16]
MKKIYLDYAATSPCDPQVLKAMEPFFFNKPGNASSMHSFGQEAKKGVEDSREILASFLGAKPEEVIFTSGGTESNNNVIFGVAGALKDKGNHIITSAIEHHAVSKPCSYLEKRGFKVTYVGVDKDGLISPEDIKKAVTDKTILISVMHANNEIGTIQPIREIGSIAKEKGIYFHTDAVQTVGHIPANVNDLNVDFLSLSAHKFYGPKGVGALYIRKGSRMERFLYGGDQEKDRRASTHNTPGIVGLGKAIELCRKNMDNETKVQIALRDRMIKEIPQIIPEVRLNGHPSLRLPNNVNFSIKYIEGESILLSLDMLGIAVSTGSACTSSSLEPSHVLLAIGLDHATAHGSLRITIGKWTKESDIDYFLEHLPKVVDRLRAMSPLYQKK